MSRYRDPLTEDLFDWEPKVSIGYEPQVMGRGAMDNKIARLVSRAMGDARDVRGIDRGVVAERMTQYLGRAISVDMLNKWSSEAAEGHRIPLDAYVALIDATQSMELTGFVPGEFGLTVIEDKYARLIEAQLLRQHIEEMNARLDRLDPRGLSRR